MDSTKEWRFGVVGNIIRTHYDEEGILRYGTKAFSGGTIIRNNIYVATDFYRRFVWRIKAMMKNAPDYDLISFMGP